MTRARTVLIVDDEAAVTRALARMLASPALRILTTQEPAEALALLDREPIDAVISDKDMPEMSGLALLGEIRGRHPLVVRILLTGQPTLDSALAAINDGGVFRYLTKPWKEPELSATIAAALDRADELRHEHEARQLAERRATAVAALEAADPRLLAVDAGRYPLVGSALIEAIDAAVQRLRRDGAAGFDAQRELDDAIAASDALGLADALACVPLFHPTIGVTLAPNGDDAYRIALELGATVVALVDVPAATGRAVAGRLACLARVDLGGEGEHFGRVQVGVGGAEADLMLGYQPTARGATIELRRLAAAVRRGVARADRGDAHRSPRRARRRRGPRLRGALRHARGRAVVRDPRSGRRAHRRRPGDRVARAQPIATASASASARAVGGRSSGCLASARCTTRATA